MFLQSISLHGLAHPGGAAVAVVEHGLQIPAQAAAVGRSGKHRTGAGQGEDRGLLGAYKPVTVQKGKTAFHGFLRDGVKKAPRLDLGADGKRLFQAQRSDGAVILDGAALFEALQNLLAHRVQLLHVEGLQFLGKEVVQDLGALLVAIHAQLFLGFRMQEGGADVLAVHLHLLHAVTQQWR